MPIYTYKCSCGKHYEDLRTMDDRNLPYPCGCGKEAHRDVTDSTPALLGFDKLGRSKSLKL